MWLMTTIGMFSAVAKGGRGMITIRARAKSDLENLKHKYAHITMSEIKETPYNDYPCRISLTKSDFVVLMAALAEDVDYSNFKGEVMKTQGYERETVYAQSWSVLHKITDLEFLGLANKFPFE